ncbi:hypothetical protein BGZ83_008759 [Gryganskiella cystojenkinii]|nr:hypothetical protein BGZ83_008759 [Gryganskiella cystojenkinii]
MSQDQHTSKEPAQVEREEDVVMTESKDTSTGGATEAGSTESKKPSGSGPITITMDAYQQLQQKRKLEQQQQQQKQHGQGNTDQGSSSSSLSLHPHDESRTNASLDAIEHIVSLVQSSAPAIPTTTATQSQPIQMPGPDLANIIFGNATQQELNGHQAKLSYNNNSTAGGPHRKSTSGSGNVIPSNPTGPNNAQTQPRTTSPPTPASGSSSGTPKVLPPKGPKPIHAIELIRIAGEILQFPPATIGTALIYYHKYRAYLHQAGRKGDRENEAFKADEYLFATACLHLACKCTEVSRKVRDLVNVTYRVMNPGQPVLSLATKSGETDESTLDPASSYLQGTTNSSAPPPTATTFWHIRDSLLTTELMLLRILQFDLDVSLPFSDVLRIYKGMGMVFNPTDEEAAQLYPNASNFDVFLPAETSGSHGGRNPQAGSSASSPNKYGTPSSSSSDASSTPGLYSATSSAHAGIHPTLSALVQISITFCIDALCNSTIALGSSSRALAMGSIYLAVRSAQLELPMPFEDWCYAWGRPLIATGFGLVTGTGTGGMGGALGGMGSVGSGGGIGGSGSNAVSNLGAGGSGMNGIMGLANTNSLFISSPRPASSTSTSDGPLGQTGGGSSSQPGAYMMEGLEFSNTATVSSSAGLNGAATSGNRDPAYHSQTQSPQFSSTNSPAIRSPVDQEFHPLQVPMTIVDEVRTVVKELASFYTH